MKHDCRRFWSVRMVCPHAELELEEEAEQDFDFDTPDGELTPSTQAAVYFGDKSRTYSDIISQLQYQAEAFGAALAGELSRGMPVPVGAVGTTEQDAIEAVMRDIAGALILAGVASLSPVVTTLVQRSVQQILTTRGSTVVRPGQGFLFQWKPGVSSLDFVKDSIASTVVEPQADTTTWY